MPGPILCAYALNVPLIPVHHIRGHIAANYITHPDLELVKLTLSVDASVPTGDYLLRFHNVEIASHNGAAGTAKRPGDIYCRFTVQQEPVYDPGFSATFTLLRLTPYFLAAKLFPFFIASLTTA